MTQLLSFLSWMILFFVLNLNVLGYRIEQSNLRIEQSNLRIEQSNLRIEIKLRQDLPSRTLPPKIGGTND